MGFLSHSPWIIWAALGIILIVAEILISGFFIFWFGVAALLTAVLAFFLPRSIAIQLGSYVVLTAALLISTRPFIRKIYSSNVKVNVGIDRLIGKCGPVLETIDPRTGKGLVRIEHEQWRADTTDGSIIEKESIVDVIRIDGTRVIVKKHQADD